MLCSFSIFIISKRWNIILSRNIMRSNKKETKSEIGIKCGKKRNT